MKILIVFESMTGNTKEIATTISGALKKEHQVKLLNVSDALENNDDFDADLYFLGSWTNKGTSGNLIKEFAQTLTAKNVALFGTTGFGDSKEYYQKLTDRFSESLNESNNIIGSFYCQGRMREIVRDRYVTLLREHPDDKSLQVSIENYEKAKSHPDRNDLEDAKLFALKMVASVKDE